MRGARDELTIRVATSAARSARCARGRTATNAALRAPRLVAGDAVGLLVGGFATRAAELGAPSDGPFR